MEKRTMGSFIAALRKVRGLTQQDVADRLNVSNKTVSKWERDEGYPEITIIPALAELFEVTSDEILRGERIPRQDQDPEKQAARVEKQIRRLVAGSIARFQNFSYLAAALALAGWIILFTIAYTFYRPLLGFGIMLIFAIASVTMQFFLINSVGASAGNHEAVGDNPGILEPLQKTINRYSFAVFMINIAVFVLSLPFVLVRDSYYVESVISMDTYLSWLPALLIIIALLSALLLNLFRGKLFIEHKSWPEGYPRKRINRLNLIHGVTLLLAFAPVIVGNFVAQIGYPIIFLFFVMLASALISMVVMCVKSKREIERLLLLAEGIRNILYFFALTYATTWITIITTSDGQRYNNLDFTPAPALFFLGATAAYLLIRHYVWKKYSRVQAEEHLV